ncbi:trace amine-associated receptor 9-like [Saccoglossus kowalevskii]|uniref:Melanopsin-A-like n=1 Tax=Saccoglossus kowalevskii TaxID=10224 RepID=A0ABM0M5L6_SACKO|nr:PREDICTED: melanopsin-A-like [Saccoglossus kowalevskii]
MDDVFKLGPDYYRSPGEWTYKGYVLGGYNRKDIFECPDFAEYRVDDCFVVSYPKSVLDIISACMYINAALVGLSGNIMVCRILYKNKELRTPSNIQLLSLAIVDVSSCILTSFVRFGLMVKSLLYGAIDIQGPCCALHMFGFYTSTITTLVSLGAISVSRAIGIADKCSRSTKKTVNIYSIVVSWITGIGCSTLKTWAGEDLMCNPESVTMGVKNVAGVGIILVFIILFTMVVSYSYIYRVLNRHEKAFQQAMAAGGNSQHFKRKPMNVAILKVAVLLISMFIISYLPLAFYGVIAANVDGYRSEHVASLTLAFVCFCSMINPIIYTLTFNQFNKYLPCKKQTSLNEIELKRRGISGKKANSNNNDIISIIAICIIFDECLLFSKT